MASHGEHLQTRVQLCGGFVVEIAGRPIEAVARGRQAHLLVAYLVLNRGRAVRREELIEALWPGDAPAFPDNALRTLVSRLRAVVGPGVICGRSELTLDLPADASVDLESAFEETMRAERALDRTRWDEAIRAAEVALGIAERGFLDDVDVGWVTIERRRLEEVRLRALECLAACGLGVGGARLSVTERAARRLIEAAPYRETGHRYLMQALAERGRVAEALQVFDDVRLLLQAQLGSPPSAGLRSLHERLLSGAGVPTPRERDDPLAVGARPTATATAAIALPPALDGAAGSPFVGRDEHTDRLWRLYGRVRAGARHTAFVRGEPGIGKTRLATEFARRAHADGAIVLYGRCDEDPLVAHQPFVEALAHYVAACPPAELAGQIGPGGGELRRLVPRLGDRVADLPQPLVGDPQGERYRLFEAVTALLCAAARARPVVLVLDDLHWADPPTLLLLKHLARGPRSTALLVLGTYREGDIEPGHPLGAVLADIGRDSGLERLRLDALDTSAVLGLVRSQAGDLAPELVTAVCRDTEGNPFYVVEMLRHLAESDAGEVRDEQRALARRTLALPEGVADVIGRRIARLGERTRHVLRIASVIGRDFDLVVLRAVGDLGEDAFVEALDEALAARVIEELPRASGRHAFTHALIRETIYSALTGARRVLLHRRLAEALERHHASELDAHSAELAHHFAQAGAVDKAIDYGARAGHVALVRLAYEQAASHYRGAAGLIEAAGVRGRDVTRCDLVIAQGEAERQAGDPAYRDTLLAGARLARELGDPGRLARAALANNPGFFSAIAGVDGERVAGLEAALEDHPDGDSATRARLLAQLALELIPDADRERFVALSDDALAMARRLAEPRTLAATLCFRYPVLWGPRTLPERLANTAEASALAEQLGDPLIAFQAARFGAHAAMEAGDLALADPLLERAHEIAEQLGQPIIRWYVAVTRVKRSLVAGAPADARRLALDAYGIGRRLGQPDAPMWLAIQMFVVGVLCGTLATADPDGVEAGHIGLLDSSAAAMPSRSASLLADAIRAAILCAGGPTGDGRRRFDALIGDGLDALPDGWTALAVPSIASLPCAALGDVAAARRLHAMLAPHAGQFVDVGPSWFGATDHHLANLAVTLGQPDEADARFASAIGAYAALGADAWMNRARRDRARAGGP